MLFRAPFLERIATGDITVAFRMWRRPTVKASGTLKTSVGVLAIESVTAISPKAITDADAKRAGFANRAEVLADLVDQADAMLYRIEFKLAGEDPRIALREDSDLSAADLQALIKKLNAMDAAAIRADESPWTRATLKLIAKNDGVRAGDLAADLGVEKEAFKIRVRRLKNLGLTESLGTGYRISPRGTSFLQADGSK